MLDKIVTDAHCNTAERLGGLRTASVLGSAYARVVYRLAESTAAVSPS